MVVEFTNLDGPTACHKSHRSARVSEIASRARLRIAAPMITATGSDRDASIFLAHRRLAILDLSPAGHQPMDSADGRYVIVYNGEIYNHLELRQRLENEGCVANWRGHSDTETLLACLAAWGLARTLEALIGMFAFALWDRKTRELSLARDRLGEKPLYFGWVDKGLDFASELKALRALPASTQWWRLGDVAARGLSDPLAFDSDAAAAWPRAR